MNVFKIKYNKLPPERACLCNDMAVTEAGKPLSVHSPLQTLPALADRSEVIACHSLFFLYVQWNRIPSRFLTIVPQYLMDSSVVPYVSMHITHICCSLNICLSLNMNGLHCGIFIFTVIKIQNQA